MATKSKFDPKDKDALVSSERRRTLDPFRVLSLIPIQVHHQIADVGCGPGFFTIPLAKYVFDGKVFALDIQQEMLDSTQEAVKAENLSNVVVMRSGEKKLPLEDDSLDGALVAFVLQEADGPRALLQEVKRCLRKSGWLAILEWYKRETEDGPPLSRRIDVDKMQAMTDKLGLRFAGRRVLNGKQYLHLVRK